MIPNLKYKTTYCHNFLEGTQHISIGKPCEKGSGCFFAHGQHDLRSLQQNKYLIAQKNQVQKNSPQQIDNYKTIYCKFFAKGQCKLGKDCTFAHQKIQKRRKPKIKQQKVQYQQYYQNQMFPPLGSNIFPQYSMYYPTYFNYFGMGYPNFQGFQQNEVNLNSHYQNNQSYDYQSNNIQSNGSEKQITSRISNLSLNEPAQIKEESQKLNEEQKKNQIQNLKKPDVLQGQSKTAMNQGSLYVHPKDKLKQQKDEAQEKNKQNQIQKSNQKSKVQSVQDEE